MVTYEEARQSAQSLLDASLSGRFIITGKREYPVGWVFFYDFQHQEPASLPHAFGNAPILVDGDTGQVRLTRDGPTR